MKKIVYLIVGLFLIFGVSGCTNVGTTTVTCKSDKVSKSPVEYNYDVYKIRNNKIKSIELYSIRTYDSKSLKGTSLDEIIKEIEKDGDYKVEKINDKEIKIIDKNPVNPFKGSNPEDLPEFIKQQMESKDFSPYRYRCTIK